tara:strand:- start:404 stop:3301 length:2898 start_codon:yes stop_codon:yes gene_type:complete
LDLSNSFKDLKFLEQRDEFIRRHIGPSSNDILNMLEFLGYSDLEELIENTVPNNISVKMPIEISESCPEGEVLSDLSLFAKKNIVNRSMIGMGYHDCVTPSVILRNILENPAWYTAYTPYQPEISQGRLEALLNFQTLISDLTGMDIANSSLLDEGTAAAEAMTMIRNLSKNESSIFFVSDGCHPQTIDILRTRAEPQGIEIKVGSIDSFSQFNSFGIFIQYPNTTGSIFDFSELVKEAHDKDCLVAVASDLMSLVLLKPPGEFGADVVVGNSQRFGVPMGFGGPHAAFFATREHYKRSVPGRIVGVSIDANEDRALRLSLQTREQHIRREKATSNICTAQVLLAVVASMYAVYHGPVGLRRIAERIHRFTAILSNSLKKLDFQVVNNSFFDTLEINTGEKKANLLIDLAEKQGFNLRFIADDRIGISLDETTKLKELEDLLGVFCEKGKIDFEILECDNIEDDFIPKELLRDSPYLTHPVFNSYHSETEMLRYIFRLQEKDISLTKSMIPLGSCTMKLNATSEMIPITWEGFNRIHPFVPPDQCEGYAIFLKDFERKLCEITGFSRISFQPNSGAQGEYAGLLVIRKYHEQRGEINRNICLIPSSAHGTNPASAVMAGFEVVVVKCDDDGNVDFNDLKTKAQLHSSNLAALMVTYPSTHGVFEEKISDICDVVHSNGGQVYMDGANLNALVGLCRPGDFGPDVSHMNLHKTFCIPHGGGGPGMGPIGVAEHLASFLPSHFAQDGHSLKDRGYTVSSAPWGSAGILPISWAYIQMMGGLGLKKASEIAILNANYISKKLEGHYDVLYKGLKGMVAHECIIDLREIETNTGVTVEDVAKRLIDFGFHAPTMSFPVPGTLMIEPTESESKEELDRFCEAMIEIRKEISEVENGLVDKLENILKNAPHTSRDISTENWIYPYTREKAVFPLPWVKENKYWPPVKRVNNPYGDRNLICSCLPIENFDES